MLTSMRVIETVHAEPQELVDSPVYRVNFWQSTAGGAWSLDAFALADAENINEVLRWVDEHAGGRRFEVFAEMHQEPEGSFQTPRKSGLVRLLGADPNTGEAVAFGVMIKD
ncbi:hypothetical protein KTU01_32690 [Kocuria turfanensis]|uniref:Uncharacterized protein n=2 Tax=Kocuria turfanensis TaxID=388357 RepID=A0A512IHF2_9MICC|nr:hypothetical protein KTU01_32690 [Kocuria turfanensis]